MPDSGVFRIQRQPFLKPRFAISLDRIDRAFWLANTTIDAFVRVDDQHVLALVEAVHGAHGDTVHGFATNAVIVDDVGHLSLVPADRRDELIYGVRHHGTRSMAENEHREDPHLLTGSEHQAVGHLAARGFGAPA